jgi:hypothetical protein
MIIINPAFSKADTGPKPSVKINFENLDCKRICYGTLLSDVESTGPASVWDGKEENARYQSDKKMREIWKAYVNYKDHDGYFFLQEIWNVSKNHLLDWNYYPPQKFKILLYYPDTKEFAVSGIYERYSFNSYYNVKMNGSQMQTVKKDQKKATTDEENYSIPPFLAFAFRVFLTIIIELLVAYLLKLRGKKVYALIAITNLVTQVLLNIGLNMYYVEEINFDFVAAYFILEFLVFVVEAIIYAIFLSRLSKTSISKIKSTAYALIANVSSFVVGLILAEFLPMFF